MNELLALQDISKSFPSPGGGRISILSGISLSLSSGEIVAITGRSGSGKSTLLSIAALLSTPDSGRILYSGRDIHGMGEGEIAHLRSHSMGFVFQSSLLLSDFSALENTAMPMMIQGMRRRNAMKEAERYLSLVGLLDRKDHRPAAMSGGERQRTAIARALAGRPSVIFADEPTGSLDERSAADVEDLLFSAVRDEGRCMLLVTHDRSLADRADRVLQLSEGVLSDV